MNAENTGSLTQLQYSRLARHAQRFVHMRFLESVSLDTTSLYHLELLSKVARLLRAQSLYYESETIYLRVLAGCERILEPDHSSTIVALNELGIVYAAQGKLDEAEQVYQRAAAGMETPGLDDSSKSSLLRNLGELYAVQGKLQEAEEMFTRVIAERQEILGPQNLLVLGTLSDLACLHGYKGRLQEAVPICIQALIGYEKALGPDHVSTLRQANNLANLYAKQGKLEEAEQIYTRVLARRMEKLGPDHLLTLSTVNSFGLLYRKQGKYIKSEQSLTRALIGFEKALGLDHLTTLEVAKDLARIYAYQGKLKEAQQKLVQVLNAYRGTDLKGRWPASLRCLAEVLAKGVKAAVDNDLQTAKIRLVDLFQHADRWDCWKDCMYWVARALFWIRDKQNSFVAFFQFAISRCDGCGQYITPAQGYFVCYQCYDTDLCNDCMAKLTDRSLSLPKCDKHEFFDVSSTPESSSGIDVSSPTDVKVWIDTLKKKYMSVAEN